MEHVRLAASLRLACSRRRKASLCSTVITLMGVRDTARKVPESCFVAEAEESGLPVASCSVEGVVIIAWLLPSAKSVTLEVFGK